MARKKKKATEELLVKSVAVRLKITEYRRLENLRQKSDCHSIGEVIRRTLAGKPLRLFHRNASLDDLIEELATVREELRAIGVNINQITRHFNGASQPARRLLPAHKALEEYRKVETKVNLLLSLIARLSRKW